MLFESVQLGALALKNRIIMAPMTRSRAMERVPNALMAEYYSQRASAGLIISEGVAISPQAVGYADTPGIWNDEQVQAWRQVTDAVHKAGGKIVCQLWHVGRVSHSVFLQGELPLAPSAVKPAGYVSLLRPKREFETPKAMSFTDIQQTLIDYKQAAINAKLAGFDGVELHAANGYLPDQFMQSSTNRRIDEYGGSLANRCRFTLEIIDLLIEVWGADRVGVHLSPRCDASDMGDDNPKQLFSYLLEQLNPKDLAFAFLREYQAADSLLANLRAVYQGKLIANEALNKESAEQLLKSGLADAVAFGSLYIANPNLPERFMNNLPLNSVIKETIYGQGAQGYTDY